MKISTRGRYGLRAILELARNFGNGPVLMGAIAEKEGLSRKYLHALLTSLKTAGLVESMRGIGGGYSLVKEPSKINLCEVLKVLEGSLSLVDCVQDDSSCKRAENCIAREVWRELSETLEKKLTAISLQDMISCSGGKDARLLLKRA